MQKTTSSYYNTLLLLSCLFFLLPACKKKQQTTALADVSSYIYAYTSGVISKTTPVRIKFTQEVVEAEKVGSSVTTSIFNISPSIEGKAVWEDQRTLLFEPATSFTSGTAYQGTISLNQIFSGAKGKASSFVFDFTTKNLRFEVQVKGLKPTTSDLKTQQLEGLVQTADQVDIALVKKSLKAQQNGRDLTIDWNSEGIQHRFQVEGIQRGNKESVVQLNWNASPLGISEKGNQTVTIPAIDDFKVITTAAVAGNDPHILIQFSDPILKNQELKGLVRISDFDGEMNYVVDGNQLRIYTSGRVTGNRKIAVRAGIKNLNNIRMKNNSSWNVSISDTEPALRLVGKGSIVPNSNGLIFPFEAVGLNAVDVEVFKIYNDNILQFLQSNLLSGEYELERVGNIFLQEKINLKDIAPNANPLEWTRYAFDLSTMVDKDPHAIYQVRVGFRPAYSEYSCGDSKASQDEDLTLLDNPFDTDGEVKSIWGDYYGIEGYYEDYEWQHRKNPCLPAFYNYERFIKRNIIASDLGIIAKRAKDNSSLIAVADIKTTNPIQGVTLAFYDYQQQLIQTTTTDGDGIARVDLPKEPFAVIATNGNQKGYLKMGDGNSLSLSRFDVAGTESQKGLKGFVYGERGVWRPGDSIYLNFILEDKEGKLPANHPIHVEIVNPKGQVHQKWTSSENVHKVYPIATATDKNSPTGNWLAKISVGGAKFSKRLKVETVKPNRLKINLDFGKEMLHASDANMSGDLQVNWLHGAPAQNVTVKIETQVKAINTTFDRFKEYEFDDPARKYAPEPIVVFEDKVNSEGQAVVKAKLATKEVAPGMLLCNFQTRAFEKGGDFSTDNFSMKYSPYDTYTGVYLKKNKYGEKRLDVGKEGKIEFLAVDEEGNPLRGRNLKVGLYKVNWRWWWDSGRDNISQYNSASHYGSVKSGNLRTNGQGETDWSVTVNDWGRYLVRVCDAQSGHCSGDFFYAGYPWYDDEEGDGQNRQAAAMLVFSADKQKYEVGEQIELNIPSSEDGRALISIESGNKIVETYWTNTTAGETKFKFYATEEMTPTVYANVSLLQPHAQVKNDLPIRLYGVIPINVENKNTRLEPVIDMPEVLEPEKTVTVKVSEKSGKPMAYTIAMVEEGLLDLTRFKTPDPWNSFYAREALGVKTWDIYDHVLGAQTGALDRVLAIGGDGALAAGKKPDQANRFEPVVKHLGPFYLRRGTATHEITVPNYIGSVRTMVVAADNEAYGNAEKTTPVRKPLMALATLPRVLSPTENLSLPVTVFAMEDKIKTVQVQVKETTGLVNIIGETSKTVTFDKPGEQIVYFDLDVSQNIGAAQFKVTVSGNGELATHDIEMAVDNPNPFVSDTQEKVIQPGDTWSTTYEAIGMYGTNTGILEVSNIPPIDLGKRLNYLLRYPHGCIEQTTSSGFPQLYVGKLMEIDKEQESRITQNITATINRLKQFQISNGAFGYWAGDTDGSPWGTNYAGHFLLEAQAKGYSLPSGMLDNWKRYQKRQANNWNKGDSRYNTDLTQAYRLYTLALAGAAEMGAMNRLRENNKISAQAKWRLAAAYAQTGRVEVAEELINALSTTVKDYRELSYTYGSGLRDEAMILETLVAIKDYERAGKVARSISKQLSSGRWYGTQTVAYSLLSIGKLVGNTAVGKSYAFTYQTGNQAAQDAGSTTPIMNLDIPVDGNPNKSLTITNNSEGILYATLILNGQPMIGEETAANEDLNMEVQYLTLGGETLDPERIPQGTDFVAQVTVANPGNRGISYEEMALTQVFPSGWEIMNTRMTNIDRFKNAAIPEYQDIRDDRVHTYFDIGRKKKQTYVVQLNAAYQGKYYLPAVSCSAMYDNTIYARETGQWVEVVAPLGI